MPGGIKAEFDPADVSNLKRKIGAFRPALQDALRTRMRTAGDDLVKDMQAAVRQSPPTRAKRVGGSVSGGRRTTTRADIAAGITASPVAPGRSQQGFTLEVSDAKLPAGRKPMALAWNKRRWRHPVYGGTAMVDQEGRPFFGRSVKDHETNLEAAAAAALDDALGKAGL